MANQVRLDYTDHASRSSHSLFEECLTSRGIEWEPIEPSTTKTPDYRLRRGSAKAIAELKTIVERKVTNGAYDPCEPIVRKLKKAAKQLAHGQPHCVVLHSHSFLDRLDAETVACAAFGPGYSKVQPDDRIIDPRPPLLRFFRRSELPAPHAGLANAVLSPAVNTRISAVLILQRYALSERHIEIWRRLYERQSAGEAIQPGESARYCGDTTLPTGVLFSDTLRVVVLANPHANIQFPDDLFDGSFDQYWGPVDQGLYGPLRVGIAVKALLDDGVPFRFL